MIEKAGGGSETRAANCDAAGTCRAALMLGSGNRATVRVYDQDDNTGSAAIP